MNPFINQDLSVKNFYYSDFVKEQALKFSVGESGMIDTGSKSVPDFRMTLRYVSSKFGMKFKTKLDSEGNMWIMRVS